MRWKNVLLNMLIVLTSSILVLVMLEVGLRIFGSSSQAPNYAKIGRDRVFDPLPGIRYLYKAHAPYSQSWPDDPRGYFGTDDNSLVYRVNNYGFRGDDLAIRRNHRVRIAVIGDSFCWGLGVKESDRFMVLIEESLHQQKTLGQAYEVYSFCMPGFNTVNEAALYEQVIQYFQPDLLLIAFFLNDVNLPPDLYFRQRAWDPPSWKAWRERFRLVDWVVFRIGRAKTRSELVANVDAAYKQGHPGFKSVVDGFERIARLNRQQGIPTVLSIFPWLADLEQDAYPFHEAHRAIRLAGEEQGFEVLDLFDAFAGLKAKDLWVHPVDQHPNEVGHRIAAEALTTRLIDVLTRSGGDLLGRAARRRVTPIPPAFLAPPTTEWYEVFAEYAARQQRADSTATLSPPEGL